MVEDDQQAGSAQPVGHETRHGPLLNSALGERKNILQPLPLKSGYGLA
ncbi:hypothetical protein H7972_23490, partial [Pseudomonas aeruginosa]|nr:hypothetical protein [Pseudomonas aeruginosa]